MYPCCQSWYPPHRTNPLAAAPCGQRLCFRQQLGLDGDAATADTEAMHAKANQPKTLYIYEGDAHGTFIFDTKDGAELAQRIIDFLVKNVPPDR